MKGEVGCAGGWASPGGSGGVLLGGGHGAGQAPREYRCLVTHLLQPCPSLVGKKLHIVSEAEKVGELGEGAERVVEEASEFGWSALRASLRDVGWRREGRTAELGSQAVEL
jgi:hypothetical protein